MRLSDIEHAVLKIQELLAEIERLRAALDQIADIADGSGTVNSLTHIAKIARACQQHTQTEPK